MPYIYDDRVDYEPKTVHPFCYVDSECIQTILKKNGKVTWGDVYARWLQENGWFNDKKIRLVCSHPEREMKWVLDIHFGEWYWIPKED